MKLKLNFLYCVEEIVDETNEVETPQDIIHEVMLVKYVDYQNDLFKADTILKHTETLAHDGWSHSIVPLFKYYTVIEIGPKEEHPEYFL